MSHGNGIDGRSAGRFGAATPGVRAERAPIGDFVAMRGPGRPARRRRVITPWRMAALTAAIIVAGGTYALGRYVIAPKPLQVVRYAVTSVSMPAGKSLTRSDFRVVTVRPSSAPPGALTPAAASRLIKHIAIQPIPAGTFLAGGLLSQGIARPDPSQTLVGLALKPGQMPAGGLAVGQKVDILLLQANTALDLTPGSGATIWAMLPPDSTGAQQVTVLVRSQQAKELANYAARGQVSLVATAPAKQG